MSQLFKNIEKWLLDNQSQQEYLPNSANKTLEIPKEKRLDRTVYPDGSITHYLNVA
jgi:hypothetical protein